jgi:hypothetical protein
VTRLTRYARGLLVAIAALALTAGAALAARGLAPASSLGAQHANTTAGQDSEVTRPDADTPDTDEDAGDADEVETPDVETPAADTNADRPQNHGWFVSEAAKSTTLEGQARGEYVASVAQGTEGKPDAAAKGAAKAAAGKAKGAAAKATHTGN